MKYKLVGRNDIENPIECILENRGIYWDLFSVGEEVVEEYDKFDHMQEAVELYMEHINNGKILFVVDSDVDGLVSSASLYNYTKELFPNIEIEYVLHTGKQHGLSTDINIKEGITLVVLPDASSNDFKQHKELKERGIDVLVLDHHECDEGYSKYATVVNNQLSKNIKNKNLSGVGVVYKFLKALDDYNYEDSADKYLDLVALGNIADVMNLKEKETRYYVYEGLNKINNLFIQALIKDNEYDLEGKYNIEKVGWTIAPKLNGTIRSGTLMEKRDMFKALISDNYDFCLRIAKQCKSAKGKQDRSVKKGMELLQNEVEFKEGDKCIIVGTNALNKNHIGLVASKLVDLYGVPILMYSENTDDFVGGSARTNTNISETLRDDLLESNLFEFCQGHNGAFGWRCKRENIPMIKEFLNNKYKDKEIINGKEHQVDLIVDYLDLNEDFVNEIASLENEWGNGIDSPLIAFENVPIHITLSCFKATNIIFYVDGIKFIKKYATRNLKESLLDLNSIMTIVGKCTVDNYNGKGQIEIVDIE